MSQFEQHLKQAQRRQRLIYTGAFFGFIGVVLITVSIIVVTRATRIEIVPQEASAIAQVSVSDGLAFIAGNSLYALSGRPALTVEAEGYFTRQQQLTRADFGKVMKITLQPLPATLVLRSPVNDDRTKWLLDDKLYTQSNELVKELEPGAYSITVLHPHYDVKELQLELARGQRLEQTVTLEPVSGELIIDSVPAAAVVMLDNSELGKTPLSIPVTGGQYEISIRKDSFEPVADNVEVTRQASQVKREYRLEAEKGELQLSLSPADGRLLLNKLEVNPATVFRLPVNQSHSLVYSKPGYLTRTTSFRVNTNTATKIDVSLEKETGQVEFRSSPEAQVMINGVPSGTTPFTLTLDALPQEVTFQKSGYRSVTKKIVPDSQSVKVLSVSLVPERIASLREAPSTYIHKAGGTMRLYKPGETFMMGAERGETGQRANEFVRTISLTRPFYAGVNEVNYAVYRNFDNSVSGQLNLPVTGVDWETAARFCNWLSLQEQLEPVYQFTGKRVSSVNPDADGYRLLSEAEWEWLARKANRKQRTRFTWGDNTVIPKNSVNIADESAQGTVKKFVPRYNDGYAGIAPTGSFAQEQSGLFDQGGNVSEWVHDTYTLLPASKLKTEENPFDTGISDSHVIKGSNWRSGTLTELRASYREGGTGARDNVGFRIGRYVYGEN